MSKYTPSINTAIQSAVSKQLHTFQLVFGRLIEVHLTHCKATNIVTFLIQTQVYSLKITLQSYM